MPFTVHTAAARLSRQVPDAEVAIDEAILRMTEVFTTAITAQRDTGIREATGQVALSRLHKAIGGMISVQSDILRAHGQLAQLGCETGTMDEPTCPDRPTGLDEEQSSILKAA
ncbi:hypothetical protein [Allopontixanthobacter sediminis]|uniref:Uncharacterized protein n=1 Tax=Allopontixanthobacter sediminis TaxID=1689985 RepID=A0A845B1V9_9SPHN|nr:hypothetical protein [Allopontixanthobacter sediminis]MXP44565.1 hypothetical protein [Allopontixanthobacter sediminis]